MKTLIEKLEEARDGILAGRTIMEKGKEQAEIEKNLVRYSSALDYCAQYQEAQSMLDSIIADLKKPVKCAEFDGELRIPPQLLKEALRAAGYQIVKINSEEK